jgi:GH15 family glucan-1,4-alpha-glucosidase
MVSRLEDYALLSDCRSAALVARDGSVDWLTIGRFDNPACFAALLGDEDNGHWRLAPEGIRSTTRSYHDGSLVLETVHTTDTGTVAVVDTLVMGDTPRLVRLVEGRSGEVAMTSVLRIRCDYGSVVPWVHRTDRGLVALSGPDGFVLRGPVSHRGERLSSVAEFTVRGGDRAGFELAWYPSCEMAPDPCDPATEIERTEQHWAEWSKDFGYDGAWRDEVFASLVVLKGLTYGRTGAIVAAPTTSLPELPGGSRNWDYRFCWLRDATFTLLAFLQAGYEQEAVAWRDWLVRAVAGLPEKVQILYGIEGERRLPELELDWLPGYAGSRPVRVGNAAAGQLQLDVYGEVMDALHQARAHGVASERAVEIQKVLLDALEGRWNQPDQGIWEVRSDPRHFTYSKVMAWLAFERAAMGSERWGLFGDPARWRAIADTVKTDVLAHAVDDRGVFTQSYGSTALDAANLIIPQIGFLPADDPRVVNTVEAIERELTVNGFVRRYLPDQTADGVDGNEGAFLLCTFWLANCLSLIGRRDDAVERFEHLLTLRNDVGLLAEEVDTRTEAPLGNFPQAFSHVALVGTAATLCARSTGPVHHRSGAAQPTPVHDAPSEPTEGAPWNSA